jgi:hypothetical protein
MARGVCAAAAVGVVQMDLALDEDDDICASWEDM